MKAYLEDCDFDVKYQQDNASIHACEETVEWMRKQGIWGRVIWWPSKSPDLNPIENVWRWMKGYVNRQDPLGRKKGLELRAAVLEA